MHEALALPFPAQHPPRDPHALDADERRIVDRFLAADEGIGAVARGRRGHHGVLLVASTRQVLLLDDAWGDVRIHAIPRRELVRVRRAPNEWGVTLEILCERERTYRLTGVDEERATEVAAYLAMPPA